MLSCAASRHCRLLITNAASASSSCSSTVTRLHHHQPRQLLRLFTTNTTTTPTTNTTSTCTKSLGLGFATNGLGNIRSLISNTTAASTRYPAFTTTKHFHSSPVTMVVTLIEKKEKFDEVINQKGKLIVLDCYATWCGPCRMVAPKIEKFSDQYTDVEFYKIDVDELSEVAADLGVRAMPTFFYFFNGEKVGEVVGANPNAIEAAVKKYNEAATAAK